MTKLQKLLRNIPRELRTRHAYDAHMRGRPRKTPRHEWAEVWLVANQLYATVRAADASPSAIAKLTRRPFGYWNGIEFLKSYQWRKLRLVVLKKFGATCQCCGARAVDGVRIHVDHIKPRKLFPELALEESNLQVLCEECNHGKGNWDRTDWRPNIWSGVRNDESQTTETA